VSGAFAVPSPRSAFPEDSPRLALATLLYNVSHYQLAGAPLLNWVRWTLLLVAILWATGWLPGRWWVTGLCACLLMALFALLHHLRRRDFVAFHPLPWPSPQPKPLNVAQKIPLHATGLFSVETKAQRYTWLPGFYRTFATREHALLCQVADRKFLAVNRWPETEVGLWYVFFVPDDVQAIRWGELRFGKTVRPAVAITYQLALKTGKKRIDQPRTETLYLAVQQVADGYTLLADLAYDLPANVLYNPDSSLSSPPA